MDIRLDEMMLISQKIALIYLMKYQIYKLTDKASCCILRTVICIQVPNDTMTHVDKIPIAAFSIPVLVTTLCFPVAT